MAERVVIEVETQYNDKMSPKIDTTKAKLDKFEQSMKKMQKQIQQMSGGKTKLNVDADDKASSKIEKVKNSLRGLGRGTTRVSVDAEDRASAKITKIGHSLKSFAGKTFRGTLEIIDKATAPLRMVKNSLFSIQGLIAGIAAGAAAKNFIADPIALTDSLTTAHIGFETMFKSAEKATNMMNEIKSFAAKTPFDTSGVISSVQQMIRAGFDVNTVMRDMERIGNAAAAAGQSTEGVQGIVLALQQMKMSGRVYSQDMMQLTNRGIPAWKYLAEAMGSTVPEVRKLAEEGQITADTAIQAMLDGMTEYDGMMDKMSNKTVSGLMSNLKDTFDIKIVDKWGSGLVAGATKGLGSLADWLGKIDPMLQSAGTSLEELGTDLSTGLFDMLEERWLALEEVIGSSEFKNADIGGKFKIAWDKVIAEPFGEWWDNKGYPSMIQKMKGFGEGLGGGLSNIFKGLLGFNAGDIADEATTIGGGFAKGFLKGFDGAGVWDAIKGAIKRAFGDVGELLGGNGSASNWLSAGLLAYGGLKLTKGMNSVGGLFGLPTVGSGLGKLGKKALGKFSLGAELAGTGLASGSGLLGMLGKIGMSSGATTAGGMVLAGGGAVAGGLAGGATLFSAFKDIYNGIKSNDEKEKSANIGSGIVKGGGVAAGAAIGSFLGPVGTLVGAGVGGLAGWLGGKKIKDDYAKQMEEEAEATRKLKLRQEQARYESKKLKEALADTNMSAAEFGLLFEQETAENMKRHFGDVELSLEEIQSLAKKITLPGKLANTMSKFKTVTDQADQSLANLQSSAASMDKWNWKAGLGMKLTGEEQQGYKDAIDSFMASAKSYVEDTQYEFTAAVKLLINGNDSEGMLEGSNAYFASLQEQLNGTEQELKAQVKIALEDGKISADEGKIISELQNKVSEITNKINAANFEAELKTLQIKYSGAELTADSFAGLQAEMQQQVQEAVAGYDEALKIGISGLVLEYNDGALSKADFETGLKQLTDGYNAKIDALKVRVEEFQFDTLAEAYGRDLEKAFEGMDMEGTIQEKLGQVMENAMSNGVDVANWDVETASKFMGLDKLQEEAATNITSIMSEIAKTIPEKMSEAMGQVDMGGAETGATTLIDRIKENINAKLEEYNFTDTGQTLYSKLTEGLSNSEGGGEGASFDATPLVENVQTSAQEAVDGADFSSLGNTVMSKISEGMAASGEGSGFDATSIVEDVQSKITSGFSEGSMDAAGSAAVNSVSSAISSNSSSVQPGCAAVRSAADGYMTSLFSNPFDVSTTVNMHVNWNVMNPFNSSMLGVSGGSASVGRNANGGFVSGKQLSWVGEEGPEAIIPLVPGRRKRGLELWEQAGKMLGVGEHATGGIVGGKPVSTPPTPAGNKPAAPVHINVGGVTFTVQVNGNAGNILEQLKSQSGDVTNLLSEMLQNALVEAWGNMPLAVTE